MPYSSGGATYLISIDQESSAIEQIPPENNTDVNLEDGRNELKGSFARRSRT
jgi:hypothetical protein